MLTASPDAEAEAAIAGSIGATPFDRTEVRSTELF